MKREGFRHTKVYRLARALKIPHYAAVGLLDMLWDLTEREAPQGNVGKLDTYDIAHQIGWPEDADALMQALVACKLVDIVEIDGNGVFCVHDWSEHANDNVHRRLARAGLLFVDGKKPNFSKLTKEERESAASLYKGARRAPRGRQKAPGGREPGLAVPGQAMPRQAEPDQNERTASPRSADARAAFDYWSQATGTTVRSDAVRDAHLKRAEARLKEGATLDDLKACVDFSMEDPFYREKGYFKQPLVFWKNAERVARLVSEQAAKRPQAPASAPSPPHRIKALEPSRAATPEELRAAQSGEAS